MKAIRWALVALAVLAMGGPARATDYFNEIYKTAASTAGTIEYFDADAKGTTTTKADGQYVQNVSIYNGGTELITVRIYSKAAPTFANPFTGSAGLDYIFVTIQPGMVFQLTGTVVYGFNLESGAGAKLVTVLGWDKAVGQ